VGHNAKIIFALQPHRSKSFKLSTDPFFAEKVRDVVGLYLKLRLWLAAPRFHVHYTPTYSSWLNQVERWFGLITQQAIRRGSFKASRTSSPRSTASPKTTTNTADPSHGLPPQIPSSKSSPDYVIVFPGQHASASRSYQRTALQGRARSALDASGSSVDRSLPCLGIICIAKAVDVYLCARNLRSSDHVVLQVGRAKGEHRRLRGVKQEFADIRTHRLGHDLI
jgi:hypothetical protein